MRFRSKHREEQEHHPDCYRSVRDVEHERPESGFDTDIDEIDHIAESNTVDEIAECPAEFKAKAILTIQLALASRRE